LLDYLRRGWWGGCELEESRTTKDFLIDQNEGIRDVKRSPSQNKVDDLESTIDKISTKK